MIIGTKYHHRTKNLGPFVLIDFTKNVVFLKLGDRIELYCVKREDLDKIFVRSVLR
jgi:hypothetical protein